MSENINRLSTDYSSQWIMINDNPSEQKSQFTIIMQLSKNKLELLDENKTKNEAY